jgi:hypothetical protein
MFHKVLFKLEVLYGAKLFTTSSLAVTLLPTALRGMSVMHSDLLVSRFVDGHWQSRLDRVGSGQDQAKPRL